MPSKDGPKDGAKTATSTRFSDLHGNKLKHLKLPPASTFDPNRRVKITVRACADRQKEVNFGSKIWQKRDTNGGISGGNTHRDPPSRRLQGQVPMLWGGHDLAVLAPQHGLARPTSEAPQEYRELGTASVGTLLGAALGAAVGGWRGAAIGGASGLALGGATGAQADAQCQRIAYQQAAQMAEAAQVRMMAEAAAHNVAPSQVAYQSVDYVTPSTGVHHKVTPLNSYTNPATKEQCSVLKDVSFGPGGGVSNTTSHQFCTGANGQAA